MQWISITSMNKLCGRWGHASVLHDDKLYVFGGYYDGHYMNDLHAFDFTTKQWTLLKTKGIIPEPRSNHILFIYKNQLILHGGGGQNKIRYGDIHVMDLQSREWIVYKSQTTPRTYHTGCIGNGILFIYGGEYQHVDLDCLEAIDLNNFTAIDITIQTKCKPDKRRFATMEFINDQLVLIGGCSQNYKTIHDIYSGTFNKSNGQFQWELQTIKLARWGHTCLAFDGSLFIFGGRDIKDHGELIEINLDKQTVQIHQTNNAVQPRRKHCASMIGNSMVVFGGFNGAYFSDFHYIELPLPNTVPLSIKQEDKHCQPTQQDIFESHFIYGYYDCTVATASCTYGITKSLLIPQSGYFSAVFGSEFAENEIDFVNLESVDSVAFGIVLLYCQFNRLVMPALQQQELFNLLELLDYLDMSAIKQNLQYYIAQQVDQETISTVYKLSLDHQDQQLQTYCAYRVSDYQMPLQDNTNIQKQQINDIRKIRRLRLSLMASKENIQQQY